MTSNQDQYLAEIKKEVHPSLKNRVKNVLRPLYGSYKRRGYRQRIDRSLEIPKELHHTDYFIDEGHYTNADLIRKASQFFGLRGKTIAVVGCGYGKYLYTVAKYCKPHMMHCIDPYPHDLWPHVKQLIETKTEVKVQFHEGEFEQVVKKFEPHSIDAILSDAVLEHVKEMDVFLQSSNHVLKANGCFYASFGPLWFAPGGDHQDWGEGHEYDHLLLPSEEYEKAWEHVQKAQKYYSIEGYFMYQHQLFSYLTPIEYITYFKKYFTIEELWVGIHRRALEMSESKHPLFTQLSKEQGKLNVSVKGMFAFMRTVAASPE